MSKIVTLNKAELTVLNSIQNVAEREATKRRILADKKAKGDAKAAEFKAKIEAWNTVRNQPMDFEVRQLKNGEYIVVVKGSGTRYGASFTIERALELVAKVSSLKASIAPYVRETK